MNGRAVRGGRSNNPVLMSMPNDASSGPDGTPGRGLGNQHSGPHVLNPLSNRSLSPASYQQLQSAVQQQ